MRRSGTGAQDEVAETGAQDEVAETGAQDEVAETGAQDEVAETGAQDEVAETGAQDEVAETGAQDEVDVQTSDSQKFTAETGAQDEVAETGAQDEVAETGAQDEVAETGAQDEVAETGAQDEVDVQTSDSQKIQKAKEDALKPPEDEQQQVLDGVEPSEDQSTQPTEGLESIATQVGDPQGHHEKCLPVFVTTGLNFSEQRKVNELSRLHRFKVTQEFNEDTTHVITKTDIDLVVCKRTMKYFLGISKGIWVLSFCYIEACLECRYMLPEEGFEVQGDNKLGKQHCGPERARNLWNSQLMNNMAVCHLEPFKNYTKDDVRMLVENSGAKYASSPELFSTPPYGETVTKVILCSKAALMQEDYNDLHNTYDCWVLDSDWLLDSVSTYKLKPMEDYKLNVVGMIQKAKEDALKPPEDEQQQVLDGVEPSEDQSTQPTEGLESIATQVGDPQGTAAELAAREAEDEADKQNNSGDKDKDFKHS